MIIRSIDIFYKEVNSIALKLSVIPASINTFVYDPRFNDQYVIDIIKDIDDPDNVFDEPDLFYRKIMTDVESMSRKQEFMTFIADSDDVEDDMECGDFNYYYGFLNDECPMLYQQSSHPYAFPSSLVLYSPLFQIEIYSYKEKIDIYESISKTRNKFLIDNDKTRVIAIKEMLKNSDRPRLDMIEW